MTIDDRFPNLLFLLTMAPMAGCPSGDDTSTSDTNSNQTTTNASTTGPETDTTAGGTDSTGPAATTNVDTTTDEPPGDTTAGLMCDEPPEVGEIDPICVTYADLYNECYAGGTAPQECIDLYAAYCQSDIDYGTMEYGEACGMAYTEFFSCLNQLSCELLIDDTEDCPDEEMAIEIACVK